MPRKAPTAAEVTASVAAAAGWLGDIARARRQDRARGDEKVGRHRAVVAAAVRGTL